MINFTFISDKSISKSFGNGAVWDIFRSWELRDAYYQTKGIYGAYNLCKTFYVVIRRDEWGLLNIIYYSDRYKYEVPSDAIIFAHLHKICILYVNPIYTNRIHKDPPANGERVYKGGA